MSKIVQVICVAVVGLGLSLVLVGCNSSPVGNDKMKSGKMDTDKMTTNKMNDGKMDTNKMSTNKMNDGKMDPNKM